MLYLNTLNLFQLNLTMDHIDILKSEFESYLFEWKFIKQNNNLYKPIDYILRLKGKRLRPVLCLIASQLNNKSFKMALPAAAAIEYFHNFTLMHDDIMDNATKRRGADTAHIKYDENSAILSGDAMMINAYQFLSLLNDEHQASSINLLSKTAIEVCEGQQFDMDFENQTFVSEADYLEMITLKTAVLIAASFKMGATIGGLSETNSNHIYNFGKYLGISFQLLDDLLDVYGDTAKFGKKIAGDIIQNKKTYLLINAIDQADKGDKQELLNWLQQTKFEEEEKVKAVKNIYAKLDIEGQTRSKAEHYNKLAIEALHQMTIEEEKIDMLQKLSKSLLKRLA